MSDRQEYYNNNSDVLLPFNEKKKQTSALQIKLKLIFMRKT